MFPLFLPVDLSLLYHCLPSAGSTCFSYKNNLLCLVYAHSSIWSMLPAGPYPPFSKRQWISYMWLNHLILISQKAELTVPPLNSKSSSQDARCLANLSPPSCKLHDVTALLCPSLFHFKFIIINDDDTFYSALPIRKQFYAAVKLC